MWELVPFKGNRSHGFHTLFRDISTMSVINLCITPVLPPHNGDLRRFLAWTAGSISLK